MPVPPEASSSPQPYKRRLPAVGLLPSGPEPVPAIMACRPALRQVRRPVPPLQDGDSLFAAGLNMRCQSRPSASSPAYRRFRVIDDAEPPGLPATFDIKVSNNKAIEKEDNDMNEELTANMGFIMGNKQRERIVQVLGSKGNISAEKIAKFEHTPLIGVQKTLAELADKKIVSEKEKIWSLTDIGKEIEKELKKRA